MAATGADRHYTYGLWRTACLPRIGQAFDGRLRSLRGTAGFIALVFVEFAPAVFFNINRPEDVAAAERLLADEAT
jgi:molybdopterin-guanine dinucleotide biosynthesis protein A